MKSYEAEISLVLIAIALAILSLISKDCKAQDYSTYQQSTQEINRQYHQMEIQRQYQQQLQQQYIQQQQFDQLRREAEHSFNQSNKDHNHLHLHSIGR